MPLSWNEIKSRAVAFTNEWKDEVSEDAEAKSFWDDFFNVFGISRRRFATLSSATLLMKQSGSSFCLNCMITDSKTIVHTQSQTKNQKSLNFANARQKHIETQHEK